MIRLAICLFSVLIVGCGSTPQSQLPKVSSVELHEFLAVAESKEIHAVRKAGKRILKPGSLIPNHRSVFEHISSYPMQDITQTGYCFPVVENGRRVGEFCIQVNEQTGRIIWIGMDSIYSN